MTYQLIELPFGKKTVFVNPNSITYVLAASETKSTINFYDNHAVTVDVPMHELAGRLGGVKVQ